MTKHPWKASAVGPGWYVRDADNMPIARISEIDKTDLRLMVAAPELLEALQCIVRGLTNGQIERGETFQDIAIAAISKAQGSSHGPQ